MKQQVGLAIGAAACKHRCCQTR